jgi:predicted permease
MPIVPTILPIFLLILFGYVLKRLAFPSEGFWQGAARVTYFIFFPVLIFRRLALSELDPVSLREIFLLVGLPVIALALLLFLLRPLMHLSGSGFTSVFQGGIRFNTYIGLALSEALWSVKGAEIAALTIALLIPIVNVACVIALTLFGGAPGRGWRAVARSLVQNPLILAALLGLLFQGLALPLPPVAETFLAILGRPALPVGLITVGAGLSLQPMPGLGRGLLWSMVVKMVLLPLAVAGSGVYWGIGGLSLAVAFIFAVLPTATSAYVLARELGGDSRLMAAILTVQTLAAMATIPLSLWLFPVAV